MRLSRIAIAALALGLLPSIATAAPTPEQKAEASALVTVAQAEAKRGKLDEAVKGLRRAVELDPTPQNRLELAKALVATKKLAQARQALTAVLEDKSPAAKPSVRAAEKLVSDIDARIPRLKLEITGPPAGAAIASLDGEIVDTANDILVDPGEHTLVVDAEGFASIKRTIHVDEMSRETVPIKMTAGEGSSEEEETEETGPKKKKSGGINPIIPAGVAFGVGALGLGLGIAFGVMAINEADKAKQFCPNNRCPDDPAVKHARDLSLTNGYVSTAMFVVGGAGVAAGVVLLVVLSPGKTKKEAPKTAIAPWIGANQIGISGSF
jgi:hypothetical protein